MLHSHLTTLNAVSLVLNAFKAEGLSSAALLAGSGISAADLCRADTRITTNQEMQVCANAVALKRDIGLELGRRMHVSCYGSGTGPSDNPEFLAALAQARDNGVVVVAVTQCHEGGVELDIYEAGSRLRGVGVLSGGGMTREAAFGKLQALLGAGLDNAQVRRLVELDLCGELI